MAAGPMNRRSCPTRAAAVAVGLVLALGACTDDAPAPLEARSAAPSPPPAVAPTPCDDDIADVVVGTVTCLLVTVPERRDPRRTGTTPTGAASGTVRVHVTRIIPPGGHATQIPILVAGTHLAAIPNYLGISPLAQRANREVLIVDARGTGHSEPSLDCPEVHQAAAQGWAVPSDQQTQSVADAAARCSTRLGRAGTDVASYGVPEMAADLEDVRSALRLERVDIAAYGTASRVVVELLRSNPRGFRLAILDSPLLPGTDPARIAAQALPAVVQELLAQCRRDAQCGSRYLANGEDLKAARQAVRNPIVLPAPSTGGPTTNILLDEERFLRVLRQLTSDGGSSGSAFMLGSVPRLIHDVAHRDRQSLQRWLTPVLTSQEPFCLGRSASCLYPRHHLSVGVWLTLMCRDLVTPGKSHPDDVLARLGDPGPLCDSWGVPAAASPDPSRAGWTAPTFVAVGRYGTYASTDLIRENLTGVPNLTLIEDPAGGSTVMSRTPCVLSIRDAWLQSPKETLDRTCLRSLPLTWE